MTDETTTATPAHKPGYRTTEFWLTLATAVVGTLIASGAIGDATSLGKALAFIASALAAAGYSYGRSQLKAS